MSYYQTLHPLFVPRVLCTGLLMVTGVMLAIAWFGPETSYDAVSVSIVFAGALIGRCLLVPSGNVAALPAAAAGGASHG